MEALILHPTALKRSLTEVILVLPETIQLRTFSGNGQHVSVPYGLAGEVNLALLGMKADSPEAFQAAARLAHGQRINDEDAAVLRRAKLVATDSAGKTVMPGAVRQVICAATRSIVERRIGIRLRRGYEYQDPFVIPELQEHEQPHEFAE